MWKVAFWKAVTERAVKSFASALGALLVADGTDLLNTDWTNRLSVSGMSALVSILLNVASGGFGPSGPSLTSETLTPPAPDPVVNPLGEATP